MKRAHSIRMSESEKTPLWTIDEGEQSLDEQTNRVRGAWRARYRGPLGDETSFLTEVYADHVIACIGEDHYSIPYAEEQGEVVFDSEAAVKVERQWAVVEALGSGWLMRMRESDDEAVKGSTWEVVIIKAGESKNGRVYSEAVLKQAAPLFEGVRVLARSDKAHSSGDDKSVEKIVGWLSESRYAKGKITAVFNISEAAGWLRTMLVDAWDRGKKDLVGLSIVAEGTGSWKVEGGKRLLVVESITKVSSTDVVFDPAAGGELVKLVAAVEEETPVKKLIEALRALLAAEAKAEAIRSLVESWTPEQVDGVKAEAKDLVETIDDALKPKADSETKPEEKKPEEKITEGVEDDDKKPERFAGDGIVGRLLIKEALGDTNLPEASQKKLTKSFGAVEFTEAELSEAVKAEVEFWADLEKTNGIKLEEGSLRVEVGIEEAQKSKAALDGFFMRSAQEVEGTKVRPYRSFREAYIDITGDAHVTGQLPRKGLEGKWGLSEASPATRLHLAERDDYGEVVLDDDGMIVVSEAISSTTFDQALGDSIRRAMVKLYAESGLDTWRPMADTVPVSDFRTNRRVRVGGFANLPTVAQNAAYAALTSPADEEATYSAVKRGGIETISLEAIANDDVGVIRDIPRKMARSAAQTLHEFVFDFLAANGNIYDGSALIRAGNNNIGSTPLSVATVSSARLRMRKQADMSSAKRIGLIAKHLWVPVELEQTAIELTASDRKPGTADNDLNIVQKWGMDYAVVDYWTDTNNWFATADMSQTPLIELGFYGSEQPDLFTQDNPQVGSMFDNDQLKYKIRFVFGGAVLDFRGFDGSIVA